MTTSMEVMIAIKTCPILRQSLMTHKPSSPSPRKADHYVFQIRDRYIRPTILINSNSRRISCCSWRSLSWFSTLVRVQSVVIFFHPGQSIFPPWSEFFFPSWSEFFSTLVRVLFPPWSEFFFHPGQRAIYCLSKISPTSQSGRFSLPLISEPDTIVVFVLTWLACLHGHPLAKLQLRPAHKNNYSSSTSSTCSSCSITLFSFSPDVDRALMPESFRITNVENQSFSRCSPDSLT